MHTYGSVHTYTHIHTYTYTFWVQLFFIHLFIFKPNALMIIIVIIIKTILGNHSAVIQSLRKFLTLACLHIYYLLSLAYILIFSKKKKLPFWLPSISWRSGLQTLVIKFQRNNNGPIHPIKWTILTSVNWNPFSALLPPPPIPSFLPRTSVIVERVSFVTRKIFIM